MEKKSSNGTFNLMRTILFGLCANYDQNYVPTEDRKCQLKSDSNYKLKTLQGKTLKFTTLQKLPLSGAIEDENGRLKGTGIAFDLIHEIQEKTGFHYNITMPAKNVIGSENEGIIQMLKNKEVDMAVTFIPILHSLENIISFSATLTEFEWVLLMARPSASASGTGLLAPFHEEVWTCILISLIIAGPIMYAIVYLRIKIQNKKNANIKPYSLNSCIWFVYGALMKQGSTLNPKYDSPRVFFASWWIFITILTSFYTANLTAFLTLSHFTLTIRTTKDIYEHKRHWFADEGGFEQFIMNTENSFEFLNETIPEYGEYTSDPLNVHLQHILEGKIYVTEKQRAKKIILTDYLNKTKNFIEETKRCTFVITQNSILEKRMAFAYQKGSKLKNLLDPLLRQFVTGGIIGHLLRVDLPNTVICPLDLSNTGSKMMNSDFATTYMLILIGFASAFITFLGEIIFRFFKNKGKKNKMVAFHEDTHDYKFNFENDSNQLFLGKKNMSKSEFKNNSFIQEYYNEMVPFSYGESNAFDLKNRVFHVTDIKPKNVLYPFVN